MGEHLSDKMAKSRGGYKFCWWCDAEKTLTGVLRLIGDHPVMVRACADHIGNIPALIDADNDETERILGLG